LQIKFTRKRFETSALIRKAKSIGCLLPTGGDRQECMQELLVLDDTRGWLGQKCSLKRERVSAHNPKPQ
jgi:hypothetical protein